MAWQVRPLAVFFHKTFMTRRSPKLYSPSTTDKHDGALTVAAHLDLPHGMSAEEALSASQLPPDTMAQILHNEDRLQGTPPAEWLEAVFVPRLMRLASQALHAVLHAFSPDAGYFSLYGLDVLVDEQVDAPAPAPALAPASMTHSHLRPHRRIHTTHPHRRIHTYDEPVYTSHRTNGGTISLDRARPDRTCAVRSSTRTFRR
jgi:hypothetical protein